MKVEHNWILRWWPLYYSFAWIAWAIIAPDPQAGNIDFIGHLFAGIGAVGLLVMAFWPGTMMVRFFGTLSAILYPLNRAFSIAVEQDSALTLQRQIVAVSFALVVVLSLLVLYPSLWWISGHKSNGGVHAE